MVLSVLYGTYSCKTAEMTTRIASKDARIKDIENADKKRENHIKGLWVKKVKGSIRYNDDTYSFKANYRIKRDSMIIISIMNPVGIEAIRILCRTDSFGFVNRVSREYFHGSYNVLQEKIGYEASYNFIQSVLLNEIATIEKATKESFYRKNKRLEMDNNRYRMTLNEVAEQGEGKSTVRYELEFDPDILLLSRCRIVNEQKMREGEIVYENFMKFTPTWFPGKIDIKFISLTGRVECKLELERITIGTDFNASFNISQKYKRIDW